MTQLSNKEHATQIFSIAFCGLSVTFQLHCVQPAVWIGCSSPIDATACWRLPKPAAFLCSGGTVGPWCSHKNTLPRSRQNRPDFRPLTTTYICIDTMMQRRQTNLKRKCPKESSDPWQRLQRKVLGSQPCHHQPQFRFTQRSFQRYPLAVLWMALLSSHCNCSRRFTVEQAHLQFRRIFINLSQWNQEHNSRTDEWSLQWSWYRACLQAITVE